MPRPAHAAQDDAGGTIENPDAVASEIHNEHERLRRIVREREIVRARRGLHLIGGIDGNRAFESALLVENLNAILSANARVNEAVVPEDDAVWVATTGRDELARSAAG